MYAKCCRLDIRKRAATYKDCFTHLRLFHLNIYNDCKFFSKREESNKIYLQPRRQDKASTTYEKHKNWTYTIAKINKTL